MRHGRVMGGQEAALSVRVTCIDGAFASGQPLSIRAPYQLTSLGRRMVGPSVGWGAARGAG